MDDTKLNFLALANEKTALCIEISVLQGKLKITRGITRNTTQDTETVPASIGFLLAQRSFCEDQETALFSKIDQYKDFWQPALTSLGWEKICTKAELEICFKKALIEFLCLQNSRRVTVNDLQHYFDNFTLKSIKKHNYIKKLGCLVAQ